MKGIISAKKLVTSLKPASLVAHGWDSIKICNYLFLIGFKPPIKIVNCYNFDKVSYIGAVHLP